MDTEHQKKPVKVYKKSDIIFKEKTRGAEMYVLRSGKVKLVLQDEKGRPK